MPGQKPPTILNVLIVDDETNVRKTLAMSLETVGHRVVAVSNARDAVAESARQPFDLAFVDLRRAGDSRVERTRDQAVRHRVVPDASAQLLESELFGHAKGAAQRAAQGSTFLNEGVALPHARIEGLAAPLVALGLTRGGVLDAPTEKPIEAVFLMLSPAAQATNHLQLLAAAGRPLQNRDLRKHLRAAETPAEAAGILADELAAKSSGA